MYAGVRYNTCDAEPDLWMKPDKRPEYTLEYYSYVLFYVIDILCIHHNPDDVLNNLNRYVPLKRGSVGSPDMYLGIKHKCIQVYNGSGFG